MILLESMEPSSHDTINVKELLAQVGGDKSRKAQIERMLKPLGPRFANLSKIRLKSK